MAHARRKFHEAAQGSKKAGAAHEGMKYFTKLYAIEKSLREAGEFANDFCDQRRKQAEPVLEKFHAWLTKKQQQMVPSTLLGKAVNYTLHEWPALLRYLDHPALTPDNNAAENAIRPFVLGRKNWLFSGSTTGAEPSCAIYSLIATAKQNHLDPFAYLYYVLNRALRITADAEWDDLLPGNLTSDTISATYPVPGRLI